MWFRRRNSITISNSDIPPAHIAPVRSAPGKTSAAKAPAKLTKARPSPSKETSSGINDITWPLQRSPHYNAMHPIPILDNQPQMTYRYEEPQPQRYQEAASSLLQDHWGYTPSYCSTVSSTPAPSHHAPTPPLPPPPPVPHFSRPKMPSPIQLSPQPQHTPQMPGPPHATSPSPPPTSPLPEISDSPSFRAISPTFPARPDHRDSFSLRQSGQWAPEEPSQPVSPISSNFSSNFSRPPISPQSLSFSRPRAPTPLKMAADPTRPAPLRVTKQYSPTTVSSGLSPTESFSSPLHTRQPSRTPSTKFNPNPPNEMARHRSTRSTIEIPVGRPRASTQPSGNHHFPSYRSPPASPVPQRSPVAPTSPSIPPTQMVHQRSISSPSPATPVTSSLRNHNRSPSSPHHHMRKQSSASSISIAIDTADEDAISALEEAVEETISRPSLSSDRTSGSFKSSRPVSPLTPTLPAADAPTVTPRPPSPANSARPTSPTCSVRPVSPTQFVITSTPRQSSPVPSTHTSKTVFSIPEEDHPNSTSDGTRPISPTSTRTTATAAAAKVGSMPTFPSRHEAKKARKAYLAAQAEAKRQSAKMGVEGILGWDAGKRAWVCKMSDEEKRKWLEKMTDGKGLVPAEGSGVGRGRGSNDWGRGMTIAMGVGRGREGAVEVGISGLGVKVVEVSGA